MKSSMVSNLDIEVVNQNLFSLQKFDENNFSLDEIETIIDDAVSSLPERCQMIFRMSKMEGLSYKQISDKLGISTNTIEGQMNIALKKLRVILKNYLPLYVMII
jgi:RNA polymerase sigma-70 factor (ECF subfamily)